MSKPRGATPSLLSGKIPKRINVKRQTLCNRCKIRITPGEDCFGIPNRLLIPISSHKKFCHHCFTKILAQTQIDLDTLHKL